MKDENLVLVDKGYIASVEAMISEMSMLYQNFSSFRGINRMVSTYRPLFPHLDILSCSHCGDSMDINRLSMLCSDIKNCYTQTNVSIKEILTGDHHTDMGGRIEIREYRSNTFVRGFYNLFGVEIYITVGKYYTKHTGLNADFFEAMIDDLIYINDRYMRYILLLIDLKQGRNNTHIEIEGRSICGGSVIVGSTENENSKEFCHRCISMISNRDRDFQNRVFVLGMQKVGI